MEHFWSDQVRVNLDTSQFVFCKYSFTFDLKVDIEDGTKTIIRDTVEYATIFCSK